MTTDTTAPAKRYLPMKESGWLFTRTVPDGWKDIGPMVLVYKREEGNFSYSCDNNCGDGCGGTIDYRLARLNGEVVMYCPRCLLFEDVPKPDSMPEDCAHEWVPIGWVRCKHCKYDLSQLPPA